MNRKMLTAGGSLVVVALVAGAVIVANSPSDADMTAVNAATRLVEGEEGHGQDGHGEDGHEGPGTEKVPEGVPGTLDATAADRELLTFLIEEEKLAYDIYTTLSEKWPTKQFTNITKSEVSHQAQAEALMVSAGIEDPRSSVIGDFDNPELQKLYDDLVAQGSESQRAAMEVGVFVEELDIKDLNEMKTKTDNPEILAVLDKLIAGSENHLAAFQKQL